MLDLESEVMRGLGSIPTGGNNLPLHLFHVIKPLMPILLIYEKLEYWLHVSEGLCLRESWVVTARIRSLGWGNVFTGVCLSTGGRGWLPSMHHRSHDWRWVSAKPPVCRPTRCRPPWDTWDTTGYGQQAGCTHLTGMHSCLNSMWIKKVWLPVGQVTKLVVLIQGDLC